MATQKTILLIEANNKEYSIKYSGGFRPDWDHLSGTERKRVLRHDGRILDALIDCPDAFNRIAGFVHAVEHFKRREARRKAKEAQQDANKGQSAGI